MGILRRLFGDPNQKEVGRYDQFVGSVNALEEGLESKSDDELRQDSLKLKEKISALARKTIEQTIEIEDLRGRNEARRKRINVFLSEDEAYAFALVREASKRTIGLRHYDVQLIGGAVLQRGQIAEMKTGEGKTLVASLPLFLNGLTGLGAHLVTVNDYLARRDAGWIGPVYHFLGLTIGVVGPQFSYQYDPDFSLDETDERLKHFRPVSRKEAYGADITYGTNNEFGFDYLRDNMAQDETQLSQRDLTYAIIDEVDSILIDEARTPLIISAPSTESAQLYGKFAAIIPKLKKELDFKIDEKANASTLTDEGIKKLEHLLGLENLYDPRHVELVHHADSALKAYALFRKNKEYVVKDGEIVIIDEFTGRMLAGRRYSGGLHQAIEAKEGVEVREESVTLATITLQNYFRMYIKLAGMTGTAITEAEELSKIYSLEVIAIPSNRPNIRADRQDLIYKTESAKFHAVVELVKERQGVGQPVLIGTISIAKSERLSKLLKAAGVKHSVLNAKQHQREGSIVEEAGRLGAVTVATNMAGRGGDIILGGTPPGNRDEQKEWKEWESSHEKVIELGGLFVVGTERHESRRIDNQLRGRCARQGDPGVSQFFLSLEDDLMRIFGGTRMQSIMQRLNIPDETSINNPLLSKAIEQAQSKVESHYFEIRKQLVDYDDVANKHRESVYRRRRRALEFNPRSNAALHEEILSIMAEGQKEAYEKKAINWTEEVRPQVERLVTLRSIDVLWVEHLKTMESLRESIGLRGYGQREPLVEYKREAYDLFQNLTSAIDTQIIELLLRAEVEEVQPVKDESPISNFQQTNKDELVAPVGQKDKKIGRNDPCPCGATLPDGRPKKYKHCHGK